MLNLEQEKRFALLASVLDLGGKGTKEQVLDHIAAKGYLRLTEKDLSEMPRRKEQYWRNDVAFVRKHLVRNRYLSGTLFNNWEITPKGQSYFERLCAEVVATRSFRKLTQVAINRALSNNRT